MLMFRGARGRDRTCTVQRLRLGLYRLGYAGLVSVHGFEPRSRAV